MAKEQIAYQVGEDVLTSLTEVASKLGVSRVTSKDVAAGGKYADQVQLLDLAADDDLEEDGDEGETGSDKAEGDAKEYYTALEDEEVKASKEELQAALPEFETVDELKEFIKDVDTATLEYFARGLELEWMKTTHPSIHRMRIAEALKRHFFPHLFKPKSDKKRAKFGEYSTEQLFDLVKENKLKVERSGNEPIDRMRAIMALKTVGVFPSE
ncbi:hypothetical protein D1872_52060 [compost metagenome]